ncbi:MAG: endolytic transglycosylase MltG [Candidatus Nealsonbacteria bacterium]|nr:endolytic transglycosylase MltG [Candidatus Nealsonbacteria bacterium]
MKYFFVFIAIIFLFSLFIWQAIFLPKDLGFQGEAVFLINKGQGLEKIASELEEQGLIKNRYFFMVYIFTRKSATDLKAGQYQLSSSMTIAEIAEKIISGDRIKRILTVIEGWTVKDIQELLKDKPGTVPLESEGYLFPDTYEIFPDDSVEEIVEMMKANFERKLSSAMREEIASQGRTISEIVIMASLIEKEVRTFEDKKIVSGILWKRLKVGMPLQVDATIIYITGKRTVRISIEETRIDSPYNTYKYPGLPVGPICNPGLESIKAAIEPEESEYWYYLSAPDGTTIFSKNLQEHNLAKAKYLK